MRPATITWPGVLKLALAPSIETFELASGPTSPVMFRLPFRLWRMLDL
jgi:hypothetical protein